MLRVEVKEATVIEKSGTFDDGRAWVSRQQSAWATLPSKPFPVEFTIKLENGNSARNVPAQEPYPVGVYTLAPESVQIYKGRLEFSRKLKLVPVPQRQQNAA